MVPSPVTVVPATVVGVHPRAVHAAAVLAVHVFADAAAQTVLTPPKAAAAIVVDPAQAVQTPSAALVPSDW